MSHSHISRSYESSPAEVWFQLFMRKAEQLISANLFLQAQDIAREWAYSVSDQLGLQRHKNWKLFKKSLVVQWFGQPESRDFSPGWNLKDALEYARRFEGQSVRFSVYPEDIACHAVSHQLPADQIGTWEDIVASVDNSTAMKMFPETSPAAICFRRYTTLFGDEVSYEAGQGQAMFVFEQERGQHPTVLAELRDQHFITTVITAGLDSSLKHIETGLRNLIKDYDALLEIKCFDLCHTLGLNGISIEGYFDPSGPERFIVVDLDLPFDSAFMLS